jgi:MFS family permease
MRDSAFWRLLVAFFLISIAVGGLIVNLPALLADRGLTSAAAAGLVGFLGYAIIAGRLCLGFLVDRFPPAIAGAGLILLSALACVLLAASAAPLPAVLLLGLCAGAEVDLLAFLVSRLFGLRHYAQIYGWGISAFTAGAGVGPYVAGRAHDWAGNYVAALWGFAGLIVIAALLILSLGGRARASRSA